MSSWEAWTWFAVVVLIAGPVVVALLSVRDLRDMWQERTRRKS